MNAVTWVPAIHTGAASAGEPPSGHSRLPTRGRAARGECNQPNHDAQVKGPRATPSSPSSETPSEMPVCLVCASVWWALPGYRSPRPMEWDGVQPWLLTWALALHSRTHLSPQRFPRGLCAPPSAAELLSPANSLIRGEAMALFHMLMPTGGPTAPSQDSPPSSVPHQTQQDTPTRCPCRSGRPLCLLVSTPAVRREP